MTTQPISLREEIIKEAKRIEEDAKYSSKEHFLVASRYRQIHLGLAGISAVLAGLVGTSLIARLDSNGTITGIMSLIVLITSTLVLFLNPREYSATNLRAGNEYKDLRAEARRLYSIDANTNISDGALQDSMNILIEKQKRANSCYPQPPEWSYILAKRRIEQGESSYEVDRKG